MARVLRSGPSYPWTQFVRGVCLLLERRWRESRSDLERASCRPETRAAALAMLGWLEDRRGKPGRASARFDEAAALQGPGEGWAFVLRGLWRRTRGEDRLALEDLGRALDARPNAWVFAQRADLRETLSEMEASIADMTAAVKRRPDVAGFRAQRGRILHFRKRYEEAEADFTEALRLAGPDPWIYEWRADNAWVQGRLRPALADYGRADRLGQEPGWPAVRRAQLQAILGDFEGALSRLEPLLSGPDGARARFARGYVLARQGRWRDAREDFETAAGQAAPRQAELARKARSFAAASLAVESRLQEAPRVMDSRKKPTLLIFGLGLDYPSHATLETLEGLRLCDDVYANLPGVRTAEFLGLFCRRLHPLSYEGKPGQDDECRRRIFASMKRGRTVGFVTRGHPLLSGNLAYHLIRGCRERGYEYRAFGAISTVDVLMAASGTIVGESAWGVQAVDARMVVERHSVMNPGIPLILYLGIPVPVESEGFAAALGRYVGLVVRSLRRWYPGSHPAYLYGPRYDRPGLARTSLEDLAQALAAIEPAMLSSTILFIPPLESETRRGSPLFNAATGFDRREGRPHDRIGRAAFPVPEAAPVKTAA